MRYPIKQGVTLLSALLSLWLLWGFWSLGATVTWFLTAVIISLSSLLLWSLQKSHRAQQQQELRFCDNLPTAHFSGEVILVCGHIDALFPDALTYRETTEGWYVPIACPENLPLLIEQISQQAPHLLSRLSLLLTVIPEQNNDASELTQYLLGWRRAMDEGREQVGRALPLGVICYFNPPMTPRHSTALKENQLFTLKQGQSAFWAQNTGTFAAPYSQWLAETAPSEEERFAYSVWFDNYLSWLNQEILPQLTVKQRGVAACLPTVWGVSFAPLSPIKNNLWAQFIVNKTTLPPTISKKKTSELLPLPDSMVSQFTHAITLHPSESLLGITVGICGLFLVGALFGSYHHNRQLLWQVGQDITRFTQLSDEVLEPKKVAYRQLQTDATTLARWQREGEPAAYSLALYQGESLLSELHLRLSAWSPPLPPAPPPPPAPIIVQAPPTVISLDNLVLFETGKETLKEGATKVLVDALINIRAKPGWLIVIAGYTDNTGTVALNQKLSLKRAESVRDWMIATSDIPAACFAVQGYGPQHPVASNETPEGRSRNRRVEIRLMPQANACQSSDIYPMSPMNGDTQPPNKEK